MRAAAALWLGVWAALALRCSTDVTPGSTLSGTAVVLAHELADGRHERYLFVRTPAGAMVPVHLSDEAQLEGLTTGQPLLVHGRWKPAAAGAGPAAASAGAGQPGSRSLFVATAIVRRPTQPAPQPQTTGVVGPAGGAGPALASARGQLPLVSNPLVAVQLTVLFIPLVARDPATGRACPGTTGLPAVGRAGMEGVVFGGKTPAGGPTLASIFSSCSLGRTQLSPATSRVVDPVELPCSAAIKGGALTWRRCEYGDSLTWADAADAALAQRGLDASKYKHHVYLLPPMESPCNFVGWGYLGCDGSIPCRAWIGNNFWTQPAALAHEIAHGLYLQHAGSRQSDGRVDSYADSGCLQGYCCAPRCWNTPHAWQLGWVSVQQLDGSRLQPGQTVSARLPPQAATATGAGLRVVPDWVPRWDDPQAGTPPLFVGYRTKQGGDAQLFDAYAGRANVYTSAIANARDPAGSVLEAALSANQTWTYAAAGLVVRMRGVEGTAALVTVCRKGGAETQATCEAGLDNDCNGLAGKADPACQPMLSGNSPLLRPPRKAVRRPPAVRRRAGAAALAGGPPLLRRPAKAAG